MVGPGRHLASLRHWVTAKIISLDKPAAQSHSNVGDIEGTTEKRSCGNICVEDALHLSLLQA